MALSAISTDSSRMKGMVYILVTQGLKKVP